MLAIYFVNVRSTLALAGGYPCTLNKQDDAQILKILDEPLTPEQGKEIAPLPKQVSWWRLRDDR